MNRTSQHFLFSFCKVHVHLQVFTGIFGLEAILKLLAMSRYYFKSGWNVFDFVIVLLSFADLGLDSVDGLSVFRAFRLVSINVYITTCLVFVNKLTRDLQLRLMRVFRLAQTWPTMKRILAIMISSLGALANLTLVLGIIIYIFAIIGMQLFSDAYTPDKFEPDDVPRWNFKDFWHSLVLIFRILCGEWIEPLWDCMRASGQLCMVVFLPTLILGNFMV